MRTVGIVTGIAAGTVTRDVARGQACLFGGLALCVALRPEGLGANSGMSYYGVHWLTVWPYAAGLAGAGLFTHRVLRRAAPRTPSPVRVRRMADSFVFLLAGLVLTPYTLGGLVDWTHRALGAALFVLQLVLAVRLVAWAHGDALGVVLFLVQLGGGVLAAVYVLQAEGLLIHGEATFQLGFALVLVRTLPLVAAHPPTPDLATPDPPAPDLAAHPAPTPSSPPCGERA